MTIREVPAYAVSCDGGEPGDACRAEVDPEYSIFGDKGYAWDVIHDAEWTYDDQGHHWCPQHTPAKCPAGTHVREDAEDRCTKCGTWPDDDGEEANPT